MLKTKLQEAREEYIRLKTEYDDLIGKIKLELKSSYPQFIDVDNFRRAFSLVKGIYQEYDSAIWGTGFSLTAAKTFKENDYLHYYNLNREIPRNRSFSTQTVRMGIITYEKYFIQSNSKYNKDIWIEYCKTDRNYSKSLDEFLLDCSSKRFNYFELLTDYLNDKNIQFRLEVVNESSLKIKNVVVFYFENEEY